MTRRPDPERIHITRRMAVRNELTDHGVPLELAERWCDAWEAEAARLGIERSSEYWTIGSVWITEQRTARQQPP